MLLHPDDRDAALSDLDEEFEQRHGEHGRRAAARWYRLQGLRSIGPAIGRRWTARRHDLRLVNEIRWAWRGIRGRGVGAAAYVGLVAVAVGASTLAFAAADAFVFRRAPYPNADRVVLFERMTPVGVYSILQPDEWQELRRRSDLFTGLYGHSNPNNGPSAVTINGVAESVWIEQVTPGLLDALGVLPRLGRPLAEADGQPGAAPVAVIAWPLASRLFGDPARAPGQIIRSGDDTVGIVGVMPPGFRFPSKREEVWRAQIADRDRYGIIVGLLAPGVSVPEVQSAIDNRPPAAGRERSGPLGPVRVVPMAQVTHDPRVVTNAGAFTGRTAPALFTLLFAAAVCLTAVACLNLAGVELASALARAPVHAVQTALGATRGVLLRTALWEGLILTSAGSVAGYAMALWGSSAVQSTLPGALDTLLLNQIDVDRRAVSFMAAAAVAAWLAACAPLVWFTSRAGLTSVIRRAARGSTISRAHIGWRQAIIGAQVTVTVVLLSAAVIFLRPYAAAVAADRGFDTTGLATIHFTPAPNPSVPREQRDRLRDALREDLVTRLRAHPGVLAVSSMRGLPPGVSRAAPPSHLWIEGDAAPAGVIHLSSVSGSPGVLDTLGLRLLAGRALRVDDPADRVVVDEALARRFWPEGNALGARYSLGSEIAPGRTRQEIVGIASHLRAGRAWSGRDVFVVHTASAPGLQELVIRLDTISRLPEAAELVRSMAPGAVVRTAVVDDLYADLDGDTRIAAGLTSSFAVLAFVVAVAGIYGVTAFVVSGRTREIGVRLALGATAADIRRSILRPTMRVVGAGLAIGVAAAVVASTWIDSLPIGVTSAGPATHLSVALIVAAAALLATLRPTRRASRLNPAMTLRAE
jgi:predicted permease